MTSQSGIQHVPQTRYETEFAALFLAHYDGIYRLIFRIVGSRQEAEDLTQETFLRLHRERFSQDREHNLRAWLYRVATNLAYNAMRDNRRQARRQETVGQEQSDTMQEGSCDPLEAILQRDERQTVRNVLTSLPDRQSRLLLLRYAGLSYKELAEVLGVSPGSIGTLLARATTAFETAYRKTAMVSEKGDGDGV